MLQRGTDAHTDSLFRQMIDLNTGVKFLENSRIRQDIRRVVVRCQIHNHTLTLCWPQTTEEGGLATSTSTAQEAGGYLEISPRCCTRLAAEDTRWSGRLQTIPSCSSAAQCQQCPGH